MGGIDSKFLIQASIEVVKELNEIGWFDQLKYAFSRSADCNPPGNDREEIKKFIKYCAINSSDTLEGRFLIVCILLAFLLVRASVNIGLKVRTLIQGVP